MSTRLETAPLVIRTFQARDAEMWAVDEKPTGTFIGQCGLRPAATMDPSAGSEIDLASHLTSASWNKGTQTRS